MNEVSWIILGILILLAFLAVRYIVKTKKSGKCVGCSGCAKGKCCCGQDMESEDKS